MLRFLKKAIFYIEGILIIGFIVLIGYFSYKELEKLYQEDTFTKNMVDLYIEQPELENPYIWICYRSLKREEQLSDEWTDKFQIDRWALYNTIDNIIWDNFFKPWKYIWKWVSKYHIEGLNQDRYTFWNKEAELFIDMYKNQARKQDIYKTLKNTRKLLEDFEKLRHSVVADLFFEEHKKLPSKIAFEITKTPYVKVIFNENKKCKKQECVLPNYKRVKKGESLQYEEVRYVLTTPINWILKNGIQTTIYTTYNPYIKRYEDVQLSEHRAKVKEKTKKKDKNWDYIKDKDWNYIIVEEEKDILAWFNGWLFVDKETSRVIQNVFGSSNWKVYQDIGFQNENKEWDCYSIIFPTEKWQQYLNKQYSKYFKDKRFVNYSLYSDFK